MHAVIKYFDVAEGGLCLSINRLSHRRWVRHVFAAISRLGDGGFWVVMALILVAMQGTQALALVLRMLITGAAGVVLYKFMKNRLVRQRPYINHDEILCGTAPLDQYSFPSGHTLHATCFAIMLSQFEPLLMPIVVPFALLVAVSRIILGLHYPSDVIAGAAIGTILAIIGLSAQ